MLNLFMSRFPLRKVSKLLCELLKFTVQINDLQYLLYSNFFNLFSKTILRLKISYIYRNTELLKMAPSYANIFMGYLEQSFLFTLPDDKKPFLWKIFMDEVFLIWTHGLKSLGIYKTFKLLSFGC